MKQLLKLYENYKDVLLQTPTSILNFVSKFIKTLNICQIVIRK